MAIERQYRSIQQAITVLDPLMLYLSHNRDAQQRKNMVIDDQLASLQGELSSVNLVVHRIEREVVTAVSRLVLVEKNLVRLEKSMDSMEKDVTSIQTYLASMDNERSGQLEYQDTQQTTSPTSLDRECGFGG